MKKGFTLAEVLITLGIIGVVAAMTIPTLMNQTNDKQTVVALKKAYSIFSQAYTMAVQENGPPSSWNLDAPDSPVGAEEMINKIAPYMKITQNCGSAGVGCFPSDTYKLLNGTNWGDYNNTYFVAKAKLADGMIFAAESNGSCSDAQTYCGNYRVDINGFKKPNQFGKDLFLFELTQRGILPAGSANDTKYVYDTNCKNPATDEGRACAAWVIYNENMDYIKCPNTLSWSGPLKCN